MKAFKLIYIACFIFAGLGLNAQTYCVKLQMANQDALIEAKRKISSGTMTAKEKAQILDGYLSDTIFQTTVKLGVPSDYKDLKTPENLWQNTKHVELEKEFVKALKNNPQLVGISANILLEKSKESPDSLIVKLEYSDKSFTYSSEIGDEPYVNYETFSVITAKKVKIGEPTEIFFIEEIKAVTDCVPFWGEIPLIGKLFQAKGQSAQKKLFIITITEVE